jgi:hypothetical protein
MHLKVPILEIEKTLKTLSSWQIYKKAKKKRKIPKNPKNQKTQKTPKKPTGLVFFKPGFFPTLRGGGGGAAPTVPQLREVPDSAQPGDDATLRAD